MKPSQNVDAAVHSKPSQSVDLPVRTVSGNTLLGQQVCSQASAGKNGASKAESSQVFVGESSNIEAIAPQLDLEQGICAPQSELTDIPPLELGLPSNDLDEALQEDEGCSPTALDPWSAIEDIPVQSANVGISATFHGACDDNRQTTLLPL
jgi:hypothetical protein